MDKIRKRSAQPTGQQNRSVLAGDIEHDTKRPPPQSPTRRKRGLASKRSLMTGLSLRLDRLPLPLIVVVAVFTIYVVASKYFLNQVFTQDTSGSYKSTIERVLHHDIPEFLGVTRSLGNHYLPKRPRAMGLYFESWSSDSYFGTEQINPNTFRLQRTHTVIDVSPDFLERQEDLKDSKEYRSGKQDEFETKDCVAMYDWQTTSFPTCNNLFEQDLNQLDLNSKGEDYVRLIANGYWRDVWRVRDSLDQVVLKTIRYEHDYEERNYDRHRRDAVAMERLTSSGWVMDIYGSCGNSGLFEFADGGSLEDSVFVSSDEEDEWKPAERLVVAYQVVAGIAAMHNHFKEGVSAIAHTDITLSQFVYVGSTGLYKLNDFNRCRFLRWNEKKNKACDFHIGNNPGTFRSPEEIAYEGLSEKIDVYSMGNVFYSLMTGLWPFEHEKPKKARELIKKGIRPPISESSLNTTDPFDRVLLNATMMAWVQDPKKRATARHVEKYIGAELEALGVNKS